MALVSRRRREACPRGPTLRIAMASRPCHPGPGLRRAKDRLKASNRDRRRPPASRRRIRSGGLENRGQGRAPLASDPRR